MILLAGVFNSFRAKVVGNIVPSMWFGLSLKWIDTSRPAGDPRRGPLEAPAS
jgi:hypothetical protein